MSKILITGGSGLIGTQLQKDLKKQNHQVVVLSRNPKDKHEFFWDINTQQIDENAFKNITHIIHLAGAGIADKRWTSKRKKEIVQSRIESANLLFTYVKNLRINLKGFIATSGVGYYGAITSDTIFTEEDAPNYDFISDICIKWERASSQFSQLNIPVTIFRTAMVLSKNGGALSKINTPLFLSVLASGKQYIPWIHLDDLCNLYLLAVEDSKISGIYNAVAPDHQTNKSFVKELSKYTGKWIFPVRISSFLLKIMLGELSSIILNGSKISSKKLEKIYTFQFLTLKLAFTNIFKKEHI